MSSKWSEEETIALLEFWSDPEIQRKLRYTYHNKELWDAVASRLAALGYFRTGFQCKIKVSMLKKDYQKFQTSPSARIALFTSQRSGNVRRYWEIIRRVQRQNRSFTLVTHLRREAAASSEEQPLFAAATAAAPPVWAIAPASASESSPVASICLQRGGQGWVLQGNVFVKNSESKHGVVYLRCLNWKTCHARAKILPGHRYIVTDPQHSHGNHDLDAIANRRRAPRLGPVCGGGRPLPRFHPFAPLRPGLAAPHPFWPNGIHARSYDVLSHNGRLSINLNEQDDTDGEHSAQAEIAKVELNGDSPPTQVAIRGHSILSDRCSSSTPPPNGEAHASSSANGLGEAAPSPAQPAGSSREMRDVDSPRAAVPSDSMPQPPFQQVNLGLVEALTKAFTEGQRLAERQFMEYDARRRAEESQREQRWLQMILEHQSRREEVLINLVASLARSTGREASVAETLQSLVRENGTESLRSDLS